MEQWTSDYKAGMPIPEIYTVEVLRDWEWVQTKFLATIRTELKPKGSKTNNIRITCENYNQ